MYHVSGDSSKPRSWSKYANDSSLNKTEARNLKSQEKLIDSTKSNNTKDNAGKRDGKKQKTYVKENEQVKQALEKVQ